MRAISPEDPGRRSRGDGLRAILVIPEITLRDGISDAAAAASCTKGSAGPLSLDLSDVVSGECDGPKHPLKPRSIQKHRDNIHIILAAFEESGRNRSSITLLRDLVDPIENAAAAMNILFRKFGGARTMYLSSIADTLRQIGEYHCRLPGKHVERLTNLKAKVTPELQGTMSEKNRKRLLAVMEPRPYAMILHYPENC